MLCSSALRAQETLAAIVDSLGDQAQSLVDGHLYGAGVPALLARIRVVRQDVASLLVVAHNPGLAELAVELAGDGDMEAIARARVKFPTGTLATLSFASDDWGGVGVGAGFLESVVVPRELG